MVHITAAFAATVLAGVALAHPGHDVKKEAAEHRSFFKSKPRDVASCASKLKARGHTDRAVQRRAALAKRMVKKRDLDDVLNTNHHSNLTGISTDVDESVLFADNSSCVLAPDVTEGPYFASGELIRSDVREGQPGIPAYVFIQVVDTSVCEPLDNIYVDFWHCNSTGVYAGIVAQGNGNPNDTTNIDNTAFRGIQATDEEGVAEFVTNVPGHYVGKANTNYALHASTNIALGRTNHIHILTHNPANTTLYPNGTLGTNALLATHVGQIYFDQSLLTEVEATAPYNTNTQELTTNAEDGLLAEAAETSDPVLEYVLLGDTIEDGILGWISLGIDTTNTIDVVNAAYVDEEGGHATGKSLGGGGGPPPS